MSIARILLIIICTALSLPSWCASKLSDDNKILIARLIALGWAQRFAIMQNTSDLRFGLPKSDQNLYLKDLKTDDLPFHMPRFAYDGVQLKFFIDETTPQSVLTFNFTEFADGRISINGKKINLYQRVSYSHAKVIIQEILTLKHSKWELLIPKVFASGSFYEFAAALLTDLPIQVENLELKNIKNGDSLAELLIKVYYNTIRNSDGDFLVLSRFACKNQKLQTVRTNFQILNGELVDGNRALPLHMMKGYQNDFIDLKSGGVKGHKNNGICTAFPDVLGKQYTEFLFDQNGKITDLHKIGNGHECASVGDSVYGITNSIKGHETLIYGEFPQIAQKCCETTQPTDCAQKVNSTVDAMLAQFKQTGKPDLPEPVGR